MKNSIFRTFGRILAFAAFVTASSPLFAQTNGDHVPEINFCDPLLSRDINADHDEDDENDFEERHRYDLEHVQTISDPDAIANALFEERWNFETGQLNPRYELCQSRQSYVVHWAQLFGQDTDETPLLEAEGLLSFQREGTFEFIFADRAYQGKWALDESQIMLEAIWMDEGAPLRTALELVQTPVEITYDDGRTDTYVEEHLRLGPFRLLRISTTERGKIRKCNCSDPWAQDS